MVVEEKLEIPKCPLCENKHIYKLEVERIKMLTSFNEIDNKIVQPVKVTRIFVCPVKNEKFQASFILYQTPSDKIKSVTVEGAI